ncbi:hypothetical protein LP420_06395 [Massilia sp. B-10]|nr:hypothetical protein LP420_06395 [Massilia sp. B-10]
MVPMAPSKSTTIRILMGLVHQHSGSVRVLGHEMPSAQALAKQEIGFVSEDLRLYGGATLQWHMDLVASIYPRWDAAYAKTLLGRFDLEAGAEGQRLVARTAGQGRPVAGARTPSQAAGARRDRPPASIQLPGMKCLPS